MRSRAIKQVLNLVIILIGLALVIRSVLLLGDGSMSVGLIMGLLFLLYGTVRFYMAARRRA